MSWRKQSPLSAAKVKEKQPSAGKQRAEHSGRPLDFAVERGLAPSTPSRLLRRWKRPWTLVARVPSQRRWRKTQEVARERRAMLGREGLRQTGEGK